MYGTCKLKCSSNIHTFIPSVISFTYMLIIKKHIIKKHTSSISFWELDKQALVPGNNYTEILWIVWGFNYLQYLEEVCCWTQESWLSAVLESFSAQPAKIQCLINLYQSGKSWPCWPLHISQGHLCEFAYPTVWDGCSQNQFLLLATTYIFLFTFVYSPRTIR